jgi:hypothetical protein
MKAVLKAFDCADHDPIDVWRPMDSEPVDYWLCCHIGPAGEEGAELFYVQVLSESAADAAVAAGKKIVVRDYSWAAVRSRVEEIISASVGDDWGAVAKILSQHFDWEFDGYVEFKERT